MKSARAVIISNGRVRNKDFFIKLMEKSDYIIAADGGARARKISLLHYLGFGFWVWGLKFNPTNQPTNFDNDYLT